MQGFQEDRAEAAEGRGGEEPRRRTVAQDTPSRCHLVFSGDVTWAPLATMRLAMDPTSCTRRGVTGSVTWRDGKRHVA